MKYRHKPTGWLLELSTAGYYEHYDDINGEEKFLRFSPQYIQAHPDKFEEEEKPEFTASDMIKFGEHVSLSVAGRERIGVTTLFEAWINKNEYGSQTNKQTAGSDQAKEADSPTAGSVLAGEYTFHSNGDVSGAYQGEQGIPTDEITSKGAAKPEQFASETAGTYIKWNCNCPDISGSEDQDIYRDEAIPKTAHYLHWNGKGFSWPINPPQNGKRGDRYRDEHGIAWEYNGVYWFRVHE